MSEHIVDLTGEEDPTERMQQNQQRAEDRAHDDENLRNQDHDGSVETESFDLSEALSVVSGGEE